MEILKKANEAVGAILAEAKQKQSESSDLLKLGDDLKQQADDLEEDAFNAWVAETGVLVDGLSLSVGEMEFSVVGDLFTIEVDQSTAFECNTRDLCPPECYDETSALLYGIGLWIRENIVV